MPSLPACPADSRLNSPTVLGAGHPAAHAPSPDIRGGQVLSPASTRTAVRKVSAPVQRCGSPRTSREQAPRNKAMSDSGGGVSTRRAPTRDDAQPEVRRGCASSTLGKLRGCVHAGLRDVRVGDSPEGRTKMKAAERHLPGNRRATPSPHSPTQVDTALLG